MNKKLVLSLKILAALIILIYLSFKINPNELWAAAGKGDLLLINLALILLPLNVFLQYKKWQIVCSELLNINDKKKVFRSLLHGFTAGIITPARIGEYVGRAIGINNKSVGEISVAALVDKFFTLTSIYFVGASAFSIYLHFYAGINIFISISIMILFLFVVYLILSYIYGLRQSFKRIKNKWVKLIIESLYVLKGMNKKFIYKMVFVSFIFYLTYIIQFSLLLDAFSTKINFIQCVWNSNLIMFFKSMVPAITFGELGVREGITVFFLNRMNENKAAGFNASILIFFINLVLPSLLSFVYLFRRNNE